MAVAKVTKMTGEELLGYAEIHCETSLALFHREHVRELFVLAGEPVPPNIDARDFWNCYSDLVKPLVAKARLLKTWAPVAPASETEALMLAAVERGDASEAERLQDKLADEILDPPDAPGGPDCGLCGREIPCDCPEP